MNDDAFDEISFELLRLVAYTHAASAVLITRGPVLSIRIRVKVFGLSLRVKIKGYG